MDKKPTEANVKLWKGIAIFAGIFSFVICFLIIANYVQINRIDPVNVQTINALVQRLHENPGDSLLREQIRELDLLARKAYFTTQWQIRTGGYMLIAGVALFVMALQVIIAARRKYPVVSSQLTESYLFNQKNARKWIAIGGIAMVAIALVLAFITHNELENNLLLALNPQSNQEPVPENKMSLKIPDDAVSGSMVGNPTETEVPDLKNKSQDTNDNQNSAIDTFVKNRQTEQNPQGATPDNKKAATSETNKIASVEDLRKNFPSFRGPGGLGIAYQKDIPTSWDGASGQNILWKTKIPLSGFNSPIIWDDKIFLTGADSKKKEVYCIDRNSGKILWTTVVNNIPGSPDTSPKVTDDTGHAAPGMATDGQQVYAVFSDGDVIALDMNGVRVWAKNLGIPKNHYGYASSLITCNDKLIIQYDQGNGAKVMALSSNTGDELWSTPRKVKISWASPVLASVKGQTEIILVADPLVAGYDPETGAERWTIKGVTGEVGPSAAFSDGIVFVTNEYSKLLAIKPGEKTEKLWESDEYLSDVPSPVATADLLFLATSYGLVACYDTKTGNKYWKHEFDNGSYSSPMIAENKVYLLDKTGVMHIFKAEKEFEAVGDPALGEKSVCTPAFSNGRIFLRTQNNLFCIGS